MLSQDFLCSWDHQMFQVDLFQPSLIRVCETAAAVDLREVYVDSADKGRDAFRKIRLMLGQNAPLGELE
jgi:hypothetical protein